MLKVRRNHSLLRLDTILHDMIQHRGHWVMVLSVSNIDIDMRNDSEKEAILYVFQQILNSFNTHIQLIQRRKELDTTTSLLQISKNDNKHPNVVEYARSYKEFYAEITKGKLEIESYIVVRTPVYCKEDEARSIFLGIKSQLTRTLKGIGVETIQITGLELKNVLQIPSFIKENIDYAIFGKKFIRTYVILDYPRNGYPNILRPLLNFPHPIEVVQHLHPYPKDKIVRSLELAVAKMESTLNLQVESGSVPSADLQIRIKDTNELMQRLASGKDRIIGTSFYVTISADSLDELNTASHEAESALRQIELAYRRARKEMNKAIRSIVPLCNDEMLEDLYTFDTNSLSTLVPFTARSFANGGILYGISEESSEIITIDRFSMPNPNAIILGSSGYGKSMLTKVVDISREMISGAQILVVDHNYEYKTICTIMGGQYVEEGEKPNWNNHMLVFGGNKTKALAIIWSHILSSPLRKRVLVVDECHNILNEDAELLLTVMKEIRKYYTAPTLITQNVLSFLKSDAGKMIMDLCSIKILMRQGENDLEEINRLFDLSKYEKLYLKTCDRGYGYIFTNSYRTKIRVVYSDREEQVLTTDPRRKVGDR